MSYCSLSDLQGLHKGNIGGSVGCMGCRCVVLLVHCALLKCRICRAPLTLMPRVRVALTHRVDVEGVTWNVHRRV